MKYSVFCVKGNDGETSYFALPVKEIDVWSPFYDKCDRVFFNDDEDHEEFGDDTAKVFVEVIEEDPENVW